MLNSSLNFCISELPTTSVATPSTMAARASAALALVVAVALAADVHEQCEEWAVAGECEKNPSYMLTSCKDACAANPVASSFYDLKAKTAAGATLKFDAFKDKVVLLTNVASA